MAADTDGIALTSLRDCFRFLHWLNTEGSGKDMQSAVAKNLRDHLAQYYENPDEGRIQSSLSTFLGHVDKVYITLVKDGIPETAITSGASMSPDEKIKKPDILVKALLECIPKFLAAIYFLWYNVSYRFKTVGGSKWADLCPGAISSWWSSWGGDLDKYLLSSRSDDYGGIIPGGFTKDEVRYGYNWNGYRYGYSMSSDLEKIFGKGDGQFFRDVFSTSVLYENSGTQISNIANALALLNTFCEIVGKENTGGGTLKEKLQQNIKRGSKCSISWEELKRHCKKLQDKFGMIFKGNAFSFTGNGREPSNLKMTEFAQKTAEWLRNHLDDVQEKLAKIQFFTTEYDNFDISTYSRYSYLLPKYYAALGPHFTKNLFPYGFTFESTNFRTSNASYYHLRHDWETVIKMLRGDSEDGGLRKLKKLLEGEKCTPYPFPEPSPGLAATEPRETTTSRPPGTSGARDARGDVNTHHGAAVKASGAVGGASGTQKGRGQGDDLPGAKGVMKSSSSGPIMAAQTQPLQTESSTQLPRQQRSQAASEANDAALQNQVAVPKKPEALPVDGAASRQNEGHKAERGSQPNAGQSESVHLTTVTPSPHGDKAELSMAGSRGNPGTSGNTDSSSSDPSVPDSPVKHTSQNQHQASQIQPELSSSASPTGEASPGSPSENAPGFPAGDAARQTVIASQAPVRAQSQSAPSSDTSSSGVADPSSFPGQDVQPASSDAAQGIDQKSQGAPNAGTTRSVSTAPGQSGSRSGVERGPGNGAAGPQHQPAPSTTEDTKCKDGSDAPFLSNVKLSQHNIQKYTQKFGNSGRSLSDIVKSMEDKEEENYHKQKPANRSQIIQKPQLRPTHVKNTPVLSPQYTSARQIAQHTPSVTQVRAPGQGGWDDRTNMQYLDVSGDSVADKSFKNQEKTRKKMEANKLLEFWNSQTKRLENSYTKGLNMAKFNVVGSEVTDADALIPVSIGGRKEGDFTGKGSTSDPISALDQHKADNRFKLLVQQGGALSGTKTTDSNGIPNFGVPPGPDGIGVPMGYPIKAPRMPHPMPDVTGVPIRDPNLNTRQPPHPTNIKLPNPPKRNTSTPPYLPTMGIHIQKPYSSPMVYKQPTHRTTQPQFEYIDVHPTVLLNRPICPAKYSKAGTEKLPPTDTSRPPPRTVREMLCWLGDLPKVPSYEELIKHVMYVFGKTKSIDPIPESFSAEEVTEALSQTCEHASSVLAGIHGSGPDVSKSHYERYGAPLMYYSDDPHTLLCQLLSYVYATCHQLSFLRTQCRRNSYQGGWRDCQFGKGVKSSDSWNCRNDPVDPMKLHGHNCNPSPLQGFLTDQTDVSTYWYQWNDICRISRVKMGFDTKESSDESKHGFYIYNLLTGACYDNLDPLEKLCRYVVCLTRRTPRTTGELVSFFHHFGNLMYDASSKGLSNLGKALTKPHENCPDWDHYDDSELPAIRGIRGVDSANHNVDHAGSLSKLVGCSGDPATCHPHCSPITYRAYTIYSPCFAHTYLSWTVYLADRLWESLKRLSYDFEKHGCSEPKSFRQCDKAMTLLYLHGFTPPEGTPRSSITCSELITKLGEVVSGGPIATLMTCMDDFLYRVRMPFIYTLVALWSVAALLLSYTILYRLDILYLCSHAIRSKASHLIDVKALLTKGRTMLSLYDADYFDDDPNDLIDQLN